MSSSNDGITMQTSPQPSTEAHGGQRRCDFSDTPGIINRQMDSVCKHRQYTYMYGDAAGQIQIALEEVEREENVRSRIGV